MGRIGKRAIVGSGNWIQIIIVLIQILRLKSQLNTILFHSFCTYIPSLVFAPFIYSRLFKISALIPSIVQT